MTQDEETAFRALARLDPSPRREMEPAEVDRQIDRILAHPRGAVVVDAGVRPLQGHTTAVRGRPRYGAIGLVASAALAMVATLLWISPSAGAPLGGGAVAPAQAVITR